jgi:hypothetical protein
MKQTAVEWLDEQLQIMDSKSYNNLIQIEMGRDNYNDIIEQAKEIDKERVIDFAKKFSDFNGLTFNEKEVSKEYLEKLYDEYYNETFKSEQ